MGLFGGDVGRFLGQLPVVGPILGDRPELQQFQPNLQQPSQDVQKLRDIRDEFLDPEAEFKPGFGARFQLEQLQNIDRPERIEELRARQQGIFATTADNLALKGGTDRGQLERLARENARQTGIFAQGIEGDIGRSVASVRAAEGARRDAIGERALFSLPAQQLGITNIQTTADAANQQARALRQDEIRNDLLDIFRAGAAGAGAIATGGG